MTSMSLFSSLWAQPGWAGAMTRALLRQLFVERQPRFFDRVHVGEAVQIKQRRAAAVFQKPNFSSVNF